MIGRSLWYILKLAAFVVVAVWVANRPGVVVVDWMGYRIESPVGVVILLLIMLMALVAFGYRLWRSVLGLPGLWGRSRKGRLQKAGYEALSKGMVAVALSDGTTARKMAERAGRLVDKGETDEGQSLCLLLTAQAAQLNEDQAKAEAAYEMMLKNSEMALLGLRGLIRLAKDRGDLPKALSLSKEAGKRDPKARWAQEGLFELSKAIGDYSAAERALREAQKSKALPKEEALRKRAIVKREQALVLLENNRHQEAVALMKESFRLAPDVTAIAVTYADSLILDKKPAETRKLLIKAWGRNPHRDLSIPYLESFGVLEPIPMVQEIKKLVGSKPDDDESRFLLAKANLKACLWGSARRHLERLIQSEGQASRQVCGLMARLEEGEHGDSKKAAAWFSEVESAPPDKAWVCRDCGSASERWTAHCEGCQSFDALEWRQASWLAGKRQNQGNNGPEKIKSAAVMRGEPPFAAKVADNSLPAGARSVAKITAIDRPDDSLDKSEKQQDSQESSFNPEATLRSLGQ